MSAKDLSIERQNQLIRLRDAIQIGSVLIDDIKPELIKELSSWKFLDIYGIVKQQEKIKQMKLLIWNDETKAKEYGRPEPAYTIDLGPGSVLEIKDDKDHIIFHIEVGEAGR